MNILQLCTNDKFSTKLNDVFKHFNHYVVNKYSTKNISLVSYDAFLITIDFLNNYYESNTKFFGEIEKLNKPIIYVYNIYDNIESMGMKFLAEKYNIKYKLIDCSVLDTPNWNYSPNTDDVDEAISMYSNTCNAYVM